MSMPAHPYVLELDDWPLAVLRAPRGIDPDAIDRDSFYAHTDALLLAPPIRGDGRFALLHDYRGAGDLTPTRRKRLVDYLKGHTLAIRARCVAYAALTESTLQRGFFTAVQWVYQAPCPMRAFATEREAREWLRKALEAARVR